MSRHKDLATVGARQEWWEGFWAKAGDAWLSQRPVPPLVRVAAEEQWFPPGAQLLELGCGGGETARWLARQGYRVTASDFSCTAIERARGIDSRQSGLRFAAHDICDSPPRGGPFGAVLDWGCLHSVPRVAREDYARNLAAVSAEDARLLLFHHAPAGFEARVVRSIEQLLVGEFDLVDSEKCASLRPGVALRFRRRRT